MPRGPHPQSCHAGLDVEHIVRLGGWQSLDMVLRYTKSVKFEDSSRLYRRLEEALQYQYLSNLYQTIQMRFAEKSHGAMSSQGVSRPGEALESIF
ncbi:MAG: hypothetical protein KAV98_03435 [Dehalococcoidia bacterium]|nr:hypothetical protein [Dehalococcoidia bacterium]